MSCENVPNRVLKGAYKRFVMMMKLPVLACIEKLET